MQIGEVSKQTAVSYDMEEFHVALVSQSHVLKAGEGKRQSAEEGEQLWKKMQFRKAITGVDQVFHQTLNLAIFWETFKYFPSVN